MSIRFDGNLGVGNLDLRDLIGLSDDEIRERFKENLRGLDESQLNSFIEELKTKLVDIEKELKDLQDGYRDDLDEAEDNDNISAAARAELRLKEIDEIMDELGDMDDLAGDVVDQNLRLNHETSENEYFSYNTGGMDELANGETVTITATGTPNNQSLNGIFGPEENAETPQHDVNGDQVIDANDALPPDPSDLGQMIFININAGDRISLVSENAGESKFKITTQDGKVHYLVIRGHPSLMFTGSNYANLAELEGWSDELLKRAYENNGSKSFYNNIHADEVAEAGTPVAEAMIPESISANYASIVAEANALIEEAVNLRAHSTYTLDAARLTSQDQQTLQKMIEALYSSNAINSASPKTIEQAWSEISTLLVGKSNAKESSLMGALTMLLAKHDYTNFQTFMAYGAQLVQSSLNWASRTTSTSDSVNTFEKFAHLILNPDYFTTITSGDSGEDAKAWGHYYDLMELVDPARAALAEEGIANNNNTIQQENEVTQSFPNNELSAVSNHINDKADEMYDLVKALGFTAVTQSHITALKTLFSNLRNASSTADYSSVLTDYFSSKEGATDDLVSMFVMLTNKFCPTLAETLFNNSATSELLAGYVDDGGSAPFGSAANRVAIAAMAPFMPHASVAAGGSMDALFGTKSPDEILGISI